jgi:membrane protein implicated in regulation of membrane protease activity
MGAVLFWLGIGLVIALVLLAARATDRRARRRGHHIRSGGDISSAALEQRRDTVASDGMGHLSSDRSWTARSRETDGRAPQTKDGA